MLQPNRINDSLPARVYVSTSANKGTLFLSQHIDELRVYCAPVDEAAAQQWVDNHNALRDSPLMKALK